MGSACGEVCVCVLCVSVTLSMCASALFIDATLNLVNMKFVLL